MTGRRWLTLGIIPAAVLAALTLPMVLAWGDLPEPMAVHWGLDGDPNGTLPRLVDLALMIVLFGAAWWAVARAITTVPHEGPSFTAGLLFIGGLLVAVQWLTVEANRGVPSWEAAEPLGGLELVIVGAAAVGAGLLGWLLAERIPAPETPLRPVPAVDDPDGVVWSSRGSGPVLAVVGIAAIVAGFIFWGWTTVLFVLIGLLVVTFAQIRATVGAAGVVVSMGWLGLPAWTIPLSTLTGAAVEDVRPMSYGGWGYRMRPGVRAVIVRSGDALRLSRQGRADLILTVDNPEMGAGLINALIQRR